MVSNELPLIFGANEFDIGDLVQCKTDSGNPLFGQVINVNIVSNSIEVCQADGYGAIRYFNGTTEWQPVECVEIHVPVNCDFDMDDAESQVYAIVRAWKVLNVVPLDEDIIWLHNTVPDHQSDIPIIYGEQERIIRDVWSGDGSHISGIFDGFCCTGESDDSTNDEYDSTDSFIDNSDVPFSRATDGSKFVNDVHNDVDYMSYASVHDRTDRQRAVRAYLNNLHTRVARGQL